jgi:uncharacterized OB-fold protein
MTGIVYSDTVVHAAPAAFAEEAPYQVAIVQLEGGTKTTARIIGGERVKIGDRVVQSGSAFRKEALRKEG